MNTYRKIICPTCSGNGFVTVKNNFIDGKDYVHQCWDCDSEGEFYETVDVPMVPDDPEPEESIH